MLPAIVSQTDSRDNENLARRAQVEASSVAKTLFSDATSVDVGELPNDCQTPVEIIFEPRPTRWVKIEISGVRSTTQNAGLREVALFARQGFAHRVIDASCHSEGSGATRRI